jgi:hypothetical protein
MIDAVTRVVIITPHERKGQDEAEKLHRQLPDTVPNWKLIERRGPEFALGFRCRWRDLKAGDTYRVTAPEVCGFCHETDCTCFS